MLNSGQLVQLKNFPYYFCFLMNQNRFLYQLIIFVLLSLVLTHCKQSVNSAQLHGNWKLLTGSKNNIPSSFLDGTWLNITDQGCQSNLFADEQSWQPYVIQDSLLKVMNGDDFRIRELTDSILMVEIIKSRNLFRLEMVRVQQEE